LRSNPQATPSGEESTGAGLRRLTLTMKCVADPLMGGSGEIGQVD
jgi:hypothetical protein